MTVTLNASSVTLQGQNIIKLQSTLQSGATFFTSSGTVNSLNIGTSVTWPDGTVQTSRNPILVSSGIAFGSSTNTLTSDVTDFLYDSTNDVLVLGTSTLTGVPLTGAGLRLYGKTSATPSPLKVMNPFRTTYSPFTSFVGYGPDLSWTDTAAFQVYHSSFGTVEFWNHYNTTSDGSYAFRGRSNQGDYLYMNSSSQSVRGPFYVGGKLACLEDGTNCSATGGSDNLGNGTGSYGVATTTGGFTGAGGVSVTYGLTSGSITVNGSDAGNASFTEGVSSQTFGPVAGKAIFWADSSSHSISGTFNGSASTYTFLTSSITPTAGQFAQWTPSGPNAWTLGSAAASGGGTPGGASGEIQYNSASAFAGSTNTYVTISSITIKSSTTFNTHGGGATNVNAPPGFVDIFVGEGKAYDGQPLLVLGNKDRTNQVYFPARQPAYMGLYGAQQGELQVGYAASPNRIGTINSANSYIDLYNGLSVTGQMALRTGDSPERDIVLVPETVTTARFSKTFTDISSSMTISGAGGLGITYGVTASTAVFSSSMTVGGVGACLANGTNCPAAGAADNLGNGTGNYGVATTTGGFTGAGGVSVTFGVTAGSVTVNDLTASQFVVTDSNKKLASTLSGATLTTLTGANIATAIPSTVLPSTIAYTTISNTFTSSQTVTSSMSITGAGGLTLTFGVNTATAVVTTSLTLPNGSNPTVNATGQVAFDTTDNILKAYNGLTTEVVGFSTHCFNVNISSGLGYASLNEPIWTAPTDMAVTLTQIKATSLPSGTTVLFQLDEAASAYESAGTDVFTVGYATANYTTETYSSGAMSNAGIAAGSALVFNCPANGSTAGTPRSVFLAICYKRDPE